MLLLSRRCWTCCWSSQSWAMAAELPAGRTRPRRPAWCCPSFPPSSSDLRGLRSLLKAFQLSSRAEDEVVAVRMEFGGPGLSPTGAGGVCGHRTATAHPAAPDPSRWAQGGQGQLLPLTLCPTRAQQQVSGWKGPAALQRSRSSSTRTSERWGRCSGSGAQRSALQGGGCSARSRDPAPTLSQPPEADPHGTVPGGLRWQRPPAAAEGACRALPAASSESQLTGELQAWQPTGDVLVLPPIAGLRLALLSVPVTAAPSSSGLGCPGALGEVPAGTVRLRFLLQPLSARPLLLLSLLLLLLLQSSVVVPWPRGQDRPHRACWRAPQFSQHPRISPVAQFSARAGMGHGGHFPAGVGGRTGSV